MNPAPLSLSRSAHLLALLTLCASVAACGSRPSTGGEEDPCAPSRSGEVPCAAGSTVAIDASFGEPEVIEEPDVGPELDVVEDVVLECPFDEPVVEGCLGALASEAGLCNGLDDDCDGVIDEGCACTLGEVQPCFDGPPGRAATGVCTRGSQRCETNEEGQPAWGACLNSVTPREEVCDDADNDCDGCVDELLDCQIVGSCPEPGDPRIRPARPFAPYALDASEFWPGPADRYRWTVEGGPCDRLGATEASFDLLGANSAEATFEPKLSGDYRVTLEVENDGETFTCSWVVNVDGPGLRVEMCYQRSDSRDLDLYLMRTSTPGPWFSDEFRDTANPEACGWHTCQANIRGNTGRVDWGYEPSPIEACEGSPQGDQWAELGFCANPRLDIDNNLVEGTGLPENINVDAPRDGEAFRVMVQNWSGFDANPVVNIYCGGTLTATYGARPDLVENFAYIYERDDPGAMWRVADVEMEVDAQGVTTGCRVRALNPPGESEGFDVSFDDPRF